jgi:hypothetical protein
MASINSFADILLDWEGLLAALREHPELEATLESERLALEQDLATARDFKAQQEIHKASRQELTQQIETVVDHGKEVAMTIRAVTKGRIGVRNERLVLFGVAPLRRRPRKPVVTVPPEGESEIPAPEVEKSGA